MLDLTFLKTVIANTWKISLILRGQNVYYSSPADWPVENNLTIAETPMLTLATSEVWAVCLCAHLPSCAILTFSCVRLGFLDEC